MPPTSQPYSMRAGFTLQVTFGCLFEELRHAVGRAQRGPDLQAAVQSDRELYNWALHRITAVRPRRKSPRLPDISRRRSHKPMQVAPDGARGRPANTAQDMLMLDLRRALLAAGLPNGFKANDENLLSEVMGARAPCSASLCEEDRRCI